MGAMLMLWHAFLFLGLSFFSSFLLFAWWLMMLFLIRKLSTLYRLGGPIAQFV
jgi:hypothetical protein